MTKKIVCFGEVLIRLSPSNQRRLEQADLLEVQIGGAEANVAAALSNFGHHTQLVSVLSNSGLGDRAHAHLLSRNIDVTWCARSAERMGLYFLESGAVQRPSKVVYDRENTAFANTSPSKYDWEEILNGADLLHISGITPAVGARSAQSALNAVQAANQLDVRVSFDGNYREGLWNKWNGDGPNILRRILERTNVAFVNENDIALILGEPVSEREKAVETAFNLFNGLEVIAATTRSLQSVDHQSLFGSYYSKSGTYVSPNWEMKNVIDRIGGGDAFAAGLLHGLLSEWSRQKSIEFATAASVFKHSIVGDMLVASENEILDSMTTSCLDVKR